MTWRKISSMKTTVHLAIAHPRDGLDGATYLGDWQFRSKLLRTANLVGVTVRKKKNHTRHYRLGEIAIVGEAVELGMRTNFKGERRNG